MICSHVSSLEKALALLGASLPNRDKMNHLITRLRYVNTIIARYLKATCTHVIFYQRNWTVLSVIRLTNFLKCVAKNLRTKAWWPSGLFWKISILKHSKNIPVLDKIWKIGLLFIPTSGQTDGDREIYR